jgi:hypothetical protein
MAEGEWRREDRTWLIAAASTGAATAGSTTIVSPEAGSWTSQT